MGAHNQLNPYTIPIKDKNPTWLLEKSLSLNQSPRALYINTKGKPWIIPNNKICIEAKPNIPITNGATPTSKESQKTNL